jgi:biotin carboxylase
VVNLFDHGLLARTAREVASRRRIVGVMCWDEPFVMPAAHVAAEFGVPGLSVSGVDGCRDKYHTRAKLTAAGLPQPGCELAATVDEARAAAARIGYPVVVKPRALGASMGVVLAADEGELDGAFGVASGASLIGDEAYRGGAIVEGYADGPEISVDGALHKGEYVPMFLARKQTGMPPYFEEVGHVVAADDPLLRDEVLIDTLARAHRVLGVEDGITHAEVRLTDRGPVIIEINGRLGGDLIPFLGKTATGIDPGEVLYDVATGRRPEVVATKNSVAGIRFGYPDHDCVVRSVTVPGEAAGLVVAGPMVEAGASLRLPPGGYIARHSFVVCEADDAETCRRLLLAAEALVELDAERIEPLPAGATLEMPTGLLDVDE